MTNSSTSFTPPDSPLRILHAVSPASVGGLERVVHALARGHRRRGHDIRVAAMLGAGDDGALFLDPLREAGVAVHTLTVSLRSVLTERRFVRALCLTHRPQIVHTHGYRPDILDGPVARGLGVSTISTEHGMSKMGGRTTLYEWLQLRALRHFDAVAAVSEPIARTLAQHRVSPSRIHVIPNAWSGEVRFLDRVDARRSLGLPVNGTLVGWMGRLIGAKGGDVFLNALAQMDGARPRVAFVGDGPELNQLVALKSRLELDATVSFLGEIPDGARFMRAFDGFVLSSRTEGTPIVLLEAMAAGVPLVVTRVGGVPDVVGEREALLVDSEDVGGLARALAELMAKPAAALERAHRARLRLDARYGIEPWLDRYERLYRDLLKPRA